MTPAGNLTPRSRDSRKREGVFYTPEPVAHYMAAATFNRWQAAHQSLATLRLVDPACGEGALLWPAYQLLCRQQAAADGPARLDLIRRQLFGVELDSQAIEALRQRFRLDLVDQVCATELERVLNSNLRCGNAVAGHGWEPPGSDNGAFHWSQAFPEVCAEGGFDIVLANPPYRRERGAKLDLAALEQAPLHSRWRPGRMDLWHYFFHRTLDLVRPDGLLTFIVNSYWTMSATGRPMVERLAAEATPLEFVVLQTAPVFSGVSGRHLIMQLRKGVTTESCDIFRLQESCYSEVGTSDLWSDLLENHRTTSPEDAARQFQHHRVARDRLFQGCRICLDPGPASSGRRTAGPLQAGRRLGDLFEVRQGIAENPPRVTRKQALEQSEYRSGEGVFVLTTAELQQLELSATEQRCVRPYYTAADISRYWSRSAPTQWLLYLNRDTAPDLTALPNIARHLSRFRPLLERRRETQLGKVAWWHLHWPRESRLFEQPRILAVQMCLEPRFAYVESPTYVGFSINVIVSQTETTEGNLNATLGLTGLEAILNSRFAREWFSSNAKRRGVNLDITGGTLKNFPIPEFEQAGLESLLRLSHERRELERQAGSPALVGLRQRIELEIDELITEITG